MKAVQVVFDDSLLAQIDRLAAAEGTSRSAFVRDRVAQSLREDEVRRKCAAEAAAYKKKPVKKRDAKVLADVAASQRAILEGEDGDW